MLKYINYIKGIKNKDKEKWKEICKEYMISTVDLLAHAKRKRGALLHTICKAKIIPWKSLVMFY